MVVIVGLRRVLKRRSRGFLVFLDKSLLIRQGGEGIKMLCRSGVYYHIIYHKYSYVRSLLVIHMIPSG